MNVETLRPTPFQSNLKLINITFFYDVTLNFSVLPSVHGEIVFFTAGVFISEFNLRVSTRSKGDVLPFGEGEVSIFSKSV